MNWEAFQQRLREDQERVEAALERRFQDSARYADLTEAMEYSLLAGGKRIRPVLTLECCRLCGGDPEAALDFACGVEMVHTYSLIHDDLPAMDDDDLRRGRPTNHKVYGEATAILAGDGLLTAAFQTLAGAKLPAERVVEAVACLAKEAGPEGMVGGQALDMAGEGRALTRKELERLQSLKTGALISAAAELGCIAAGGTAEQRAAVRTYAQCLGRAFQSADLCPVPGPGLSDPGRHSGCDRDGGGAGKAHRFGPGQRKEHLCHRSGPGGEPCFGAQAHRSGGGGFGRV